MINELCYPGDWGSLGNFGVWGWVGLIVTLIFWVGLFASLALLVILAVRRARVPAATVPSAPRQQTTKQVLQARYARGEITREQYELMKRDIG